MLAVFATLEGERGRSGRTGRIISITIGGRAVPGHLPEPGSDVPLQGADIAFQVCGAGCAAELQGAIRLDTSRPVVH